MITIKEAKSKEDILKAIFLRRKTLVHEYKYSVHECEPEEEDVRSKVYVAKDGSRVVGTARVKKEGTICRIQRMAVEKKSRGQGVGSKIVQRIIRDFKGKNIYVMSPKATIPFYEQFGFQKTSIKQKGKHHIYYRLQNY